MDSFHETNPIDNGARAGFYGVTTSSQGFIDGYSKGDFDDVPNWTDTEFSLRSLVASPVEITLSSPALPENLFNVQANIKLIDNLPKGKYAVFMAIIEDVPGTEDYVLRKLLPNASGTELTIRNNQEEQTINVSYDLRFVEDPTQINVVAFVQAIEWANPTQRKEVLQAKLLNNTGLTIPTNIVTGIEDEDYTFGVYPNPADKQLIVNLPIAATQQTPMILFDQMGKMVYQVNFEKGEQSKQVETTELAAGVYLIKIETQQGMLMKKLVISHRQ
jgi:Secretion system C-terminal sorting domain